VKLWRIGFVKHVGTFKPGVKERWRHATSSERRPSGSFHFVHSSFFCSFTPGWLRGTAAERRSLAGELSLSCAQPVADW